MMTRNLDLWVARLGDLLTREYGPRYDPLFKWVRNPLAILGVAAVASALCGMFLNPRAFVFALGLVAVMVMGVAWPWLSLRGVSGRLSFGRTRAREGESVAAHLAIRNRMPWGAWGLSVHGAVVERSEGGGAAGAIASLAHAAGWRTTQVCWDVVPACRGEYPRVLPEIATAFPFGLWETSRPLEVPAPLLVWPRTFPVGPVPEAARGREGDGLAPRNKAGNAGDPLGVRAYRRGDSLRRVHWPQTARQGNLVVCELHTLSVARVQVVLDAQPRAHLGSAPDGSLEWSVRIAASFAESWIGRGTEVELVLGDQVVRASAGPVRARQARVLDALARVGPDGTPALGEVLEGPACRGFTEGLRIVVTTDLGLGRLPPRGLAGKVERLVVLRASAFGEGALVGSVAPSVRPWIWVDDPDRVPQIVRRSWKEVPIGR